LVSGMSNPEKVLSFLDVFGAWDISLMFVMIGAIVVAFIPFQKALRSPKTSRKLNTFSGFDIPETNRPNANMLPKRNANRFFIMLPPQDDAPHTQ